MKFLGMEFAPLSVPLHKRMETLAVIHYVVMFLCLPTVCVFVPIYLLGWTSLWWLTLLYFAWFFYDYSTPIRGGRPKRWFRYSPVWNYFRDYFPIQLIKTAELDPNRNYIMGYHPHGVISVGMFANFATEATGFSKKFPGITVHPCTLNGQFWFPLRREYIMLSGAIGVSRKSIEYILRQPTKGHAVAIVIGGASEALNAHPGRYNLILDKRKGFIKTALRNGADLVPVFSFGENDLYIQADNSDGSLLRKIQVKLKAVCGFSLPVFHGRGVYNYTFGFIPYRKPIWTVAQTKIFENYTILGIVSDLRRIWNGRPSYSRMRFLLQNEVKTLHYKDVFTVGSHPFHGFYRSWDWINSKVFMTSIGSPIRVEKCENPSKQQIDNLHAKYIDHLISLFDDNKTKYGVPKNARITVS